MAMPRLPMATDAMSEDLVALIAASAAFSAVMLGSTPSQVAAAVHGTVNSMKEFVVNSCFFCIPSAPLSRSARRRAPSLRPRAESQRVSPAGAALADARRASGHAPGDRGRQRGRWARITALRLRRPLQHPRRLRHLRTCRRGRRHRPLRPGSGWRSSTPGSAGRACCRPD